MISSIQLETFYERYQREGVPNDLSMQAFCSMLQKGSLLEIYTRKGEDSSTIEFETAALNQILYWGLPSPIWNVPYSSFELSRRGDSIAGGLFND